MQKSYKLLIAAALGCILMLSVLAGYLLARNDSQPDNNAPAATAVAAAHQTQAPEPTTMPVFKIKLDDSVLRMYSDNTVIKETVISPDVYPTDDIAELTAGTVYPCLEDALIDWESLCE